jgi:hypothetical protein
LAPRGLEGSLTGRGTEAFNLLAFPLGYCPALGTGEERDTKLNLDTLGMLAVLHPTVSE